MPDYPKEEERPVSEGSGQALSGPNRMDISLLYVEDDETSRKAVSEMLRKRVERLYVASNGIEGLELFERYRPEILITDIRMPLMDGIELSSKIKAIDSSAHIVITSAYSEIEYFMDAIDIGVDQYVLKPIETVKLFYSLQKVYEVIQLRRQVEEQVRQRENLIKELQEALNSIKILKGLIPICASCKKIRDDSGYWSQLELYITQHSDAEFSHGICPDCAAKLYGDYLKEP